MSESGGIRAGEYAAEAESSDDAPIRFLGRIQAPWANRRHCARQGRQDGPEGRVEVFEPWVAVPDGVEKFETLEILFWLNRARRDLVRQNPRHDDNTYGTFALPLPVPPNPIGTALVRLAAN